MKHALSSRTTLAATLLSLLFPLSALAGSPMESPLYRFADTSVVPDAQSVLVTTERAAFMKLRTSELGPGHAFTIWWIVFNNPEFCTHGTGVSRCGRGDHPMMGGDPAVQSSVLFGDGKVIGASGEGMFSSRLPVGDTTGALFGPSLLNPLGAEIHFVVRDHGPMDPRLMPDQIREVGVCNPTCEDLQFSVHQQQ